MCIIKVRLIHNTTIFANTRKETVVTNSFDENKQVYRQKTNQCDARISPVTIHAVLQHATDEHYSIQEM